MKLFERPTITVADAEGGVCLSVEIEPPWEQGYDLSYNWAIAELSRTDIEELRDELTRWLAR
jgi:hypothetical protein